MSHSKGTMSEAEVEQQYQLLHKLQVFHIHGRDKLGRKLLTIRAKFFPGRRVRIEVINKYLEDKIYPRLLKKGPFSVLFLHTDVNKSENYPGLSALRCIYDHIPAQIKNNLEAVYFVHPGLQSRLFLATFVRLFFSSGLYGKVKYVSRVDYLWENIKRNEVVLPDYVYEHDEELEYRPMMDYGLESDHPRVYGAPSVDNPVASFSMRCIS